MTVNQDAIAAQRFESKTWQTHRGALALPTAALKHPETGAEFPLVDVGGLFPDVAKNWTRPLAEISGFAFHHDAVAFTGRDVNFNGHTTDEAFQRLQAIYDHHTKANPWNGIGYHVVVDLEGRLYIARLDVLQTHRAHVSTSAAAGTILFPKAGAPNWNRQLVGVCFMGNYSDRLDPSGKGIAPTNDRPTAAALQAADAFCRQVTNGLGRALTLRGHKAYQSKECPGDWSTPESGATFRYEPTAAPAPAPTLDLMLLNDRVTDALGQLDLARADLAAAQQLIEAEASRKGVTL